MAAPSSSPAGGGAFIALGAIGGTVIGLIAWQPSLGFLVGLALGIAASLWVWWRGR